MSMTHHACLYQGTDSTALPEALQQPRLGVQHSVVASFGIDDARALAQAAHIKPVGVDHEMFVVIAPVITVEAQNALLKLLEEPPATSRFSIVVPHPGQLLPTLLSRLQYVTGSEMRNATNDVYETFRTLPLKERLTEITDRAKAKDTTWQQEIFSGALFDEGLDRHTRLLISKYSSIRGAMKKWLLEEITLQLG